MVNKTPCNVTEWCIDSFETQTFKTWSNEGWNFKARFRHLLCIPGILIPTAIDIILALGTTLIFFVSFGFYEKAAEAALEFGILIKKIL